MEEMILGIGFGLWGGVPLYAIGTIDGRRRERESRLALEKIRQESARLNPYRDEGT
jgi:hypothetical protein